MSDEALRVTGNQAQALGALYWLVFAGFLIGVYAVKVILNPPDWAFFAILGTGVAVLLTVGTSVGQKRKLGKPVALVIPWSSVRAVRVHEEEAGVVVVLVKKFKPKGELFFTPAGGAEAFMDALREHSAKP